MPLQLKPLAPGDAGLIAELIQGSVRALQLEYTVPQRHAALQTVFTVDSSLLEDGTYFGVFTEEHRLIGCGGWSYRTTLYGGDRHIEPSHHPDSPLTHLNPATDAAKIRAIFVHPQFARHGIGSMLLQAAEQAAHAAGFRRFEMGSTLTGLSLYTRSGYREIARFLVPVGSGETIEVVHMVKTL